MRLVENDHVIQTLSADRADQAFDVRILPGTRRGGDDFSDAHARESPPEDVAVDVVAISMQPAGRGVVRECVDHLLSGPYGCRMLRDIEMHDAPAVMRQHDQDEQQSYLHGHSALSRASSRHSGGKGGRGRTTLISDTVLPVYSGDRAIRSSEAVASRRGDPRDPVVEGGQHALVTRPRRLTGMSRMTPIGCRCATSRWLASCEARSSVSLDARGGGGGASRAAVQGGTRLKARPRPRRAAGRERRACRSGRADSRAT
jgi:hypothetical protein